MNQPATRIPDTLSPWLTLRASVLDAPSWLVLASHYAGRGLQWQSAYATRQAVRSDPTLKPQVEPQSLDADQEAGDALLGRARIDGAAELAERFTVAVDHEPDDWLTWLYLARLHDMLGNTQAHEHALAHARAQQLLPGESMHWLGVWRLSAGDAQGAVAALSTLVDVRPVRHDSMMYLGEALLRTGNTAAAEKAFTRASLSPNPDFLPHLA